MHYAKWDPDAVLHAENMSFHNIRILALAFWKTINIQKSYKLTYLKIMLIALIFLPIASIFRAYFPPVIVEKKIYDEIDINSLDKMYDEFQKLNVTLPRDMIIFTPPDKFFESIMQLTISRLKLKKYIAVDSYEEMENLINSKHYLAAVRFNKDLSTGGLDYEIGFPALFRTAKNPSFWGTDKLFRSDVKCDKSNYTCTPPGYFEEGFVQIQHAIAMSYLELKTDNITDLPIFNIVMNKFPTNRYTVDPYRSQMKVLLSVGILFAYVFPTFATVRAITDEEERGIMKMLNIKIKNWCAWLIILFILQTMTTLFVLITLHMSWAEYTIFTYTDSWPVFIFLLCYVCASSSFILMISIVLIQKRQSAKYALTLRLFAVVLLPFNLHLEWSSLYKTIACLSLDNALLMGLNIIMDYESVGDSLKLKYFTLPHFAGTDFSLMHAIGMLLFDSVLYVLILLYYHYKEVTTVSATNKESSRKWYYPLEFLLCFRKPKVLLKKIGLFLLHNLTVHEDDLIDNYPSFRPHELNDKVTQTDWNMGRQHRGTMTWRPNILSTISARVTSVTSLIVSNVKHFREHKRAQNIQETDSIYSSRSPLDSHLSHGTSSLNGMSSQSLQSLNLINNEPLFDTSQGIQVQNVSKEIGYVKYLDDVSINIHPMEITIILGKSNESRMFLSHIIAGNVTPDSGQVIINNENVAQYKGNETLCCLLPTDSIIFTQLSTTENMFFYTHLKGMRNFRQIVREIDKYLALLKMSLSEAEQLTDEMSFGQARCLSLCCVLCGGNHAVIVDHPSIGLNQESRYLMWDILKAAARTRVVIVNTIYCDEAEILGNRIAVLHDSKLQCYDRGKRLRELFCNIYILHCAIKDDEVADNTHKEFYKLLLKHFPSDASAEYLPNLSKIEITFTAVTERRLVVYLIELERMREDLGLGNIWIRRSTLRDVFVNENVNVFSGPDSKDKILPQIINSSNLNENNKRELRRQQFRVFSKKKILLLKRFFWIVLLVIIGIPLCILMNSQTSNFENLPQINLSIASYSDTSVILKRNSRLDPMMLNHKISNSYMKYNQFIRKQYNVDMYQIIELAGRREIKSFFLYLEMVSSLGVQSFYIAAADFHPNKTISYWNNKLIHSAPISLNMIHNALSFYLVGPETQIRVANLPIAHGDRNILSQMNVHYGLKIGIGFGVMLALCTVVSLLGIPVMWERVSGNMRMQILGGDTKVMYWTSHILMDAIIYIAIVVYIIAMLLLHDAIVHRHDRPNYVDDIQLVFAILFALIQFGFAALPFVHLMCWLFKRVFLGFAITLLILVCSSIGVMIAFIANGYYFVILRRVFFWSPSFILFMTLRRVHISGALRRACRHLGGCSQESNCCTLSGFYGYEYPGILSEVLVLFCQGILYTTLVVYLYWNPLFFEYNCFAQKKQLQASKTEDVHLFDEKKFVHDLSGKRLQSMPLVVKGLSNHLNLKELWFYVKPGEVFGILGPTNSGQTTLINSITGEKPIGSGKIYISGVSIRRNLMTSFKYFGYSPHINTLLDFMTVKEILYFYCILGGYKHRLVPDIVKSLCTYLELDSLINTPVSRLYFSDKRKVALTITLLCGKKFIIFDKPTHCMDPNHKRLIWPFIKLLKLSGCTVVLTTHDIDEAIYLCDKIAIMSKGDFKTVGSVDFLISQNSPGYTLEITRTRVMYSRNPDNVKTKESYIKVVRTSFGAEDSSDSEEYTLQNSARSSILFDDPLYAEWAKKAARYSNILAFMNEEFAFANLQENYNNILVYFIPFSKITLSDIFKAMYAAREILDVYSYNITRPSLEEYYEEKFRQDEKHVIGK